MKTPNEALAYWLEAGGIEPIADDIADLADLAGQLFERCGHLRGTEAAEAVIEADGDHPWTKIEALLWKAGYEAGLSAGLNFPCEQAAESAATDFSEWVETAPKKSYENAEPIHGGKDA